MTGPSVTCLGILASHRGSNALAVIGAAQQGQLALSVGAVISNNSDAPVLSGARRLGVPARHLSRRTHPVPSALNGEIVAELAERGVDLVLLAGYFRPLGDAVLQAFPGRVVNLHPSLAPRHTGPGMVGRAVHQAVLRSGDRVSGVTLHMVKQAYVPGPVVRQSVIPVHRDDTVDSLEKRILAREPSFITECLRDIACGNLRLPAVTLPAVSGAGPAG